MIRIKYKATQAIHQANFVHLLVLVDEQEQRQLVVVTDQPTAVNITATVAARQDPIARRLFFERSAVYVLAKLFPEEMRKLMYIHVDGIAGGQYNATLVRRNAELNEMPQDIRISEAILLSVITDIPIYIDEHLWRTQSTVFNPVSNGMAIPANTLPLNMLKDALKQAIDKEEYEVAKVLNDEIHNRFPQEK